MAEPQQEEPSPLLRLPENVMELILKKLTTAELICFSYCSPKSTEIVQNFRPDPMGEIMIYLKKDSVWIHFIRNFYTGNRWIIWKSTTSTQRAPMMLSSAAGNVVAINSSYDFGVLEHYHAAKDYNKAVATAIKQLRLLFRTINTIVTVEMDEYRYWDKSPIWKALGQCQQLYLDGKYLSSQSIKNFFKSCQVTNHFCSSAYLDGDLLSTFYVSHLKHTDKVYIQNARWAMTRHLNMFKGVELTLCNTELTNDQLNSWLKNWLETFDTKIEYVKVETKVELDVVEILQGIQYQTTNTTHIVQNGNRNELFTVMIPRMDGRNVWLKIENKEMLAFMKNT